MTHASGAAAGGGAARPAQTRTSFAALAVLLRRSPPSHMPSSPTASTPRPPRWFPILERGGWLESRLVAWHGPGCAFFVHAEGGKPVSVRGCCATLSRPQEARSLLFPLRGVTLPEHQPSQLGRATTDKATQVPPLKFGKKTTAVEQMAGRRSRSGPTHRPIHRECRWGAGKAEGAPVGITAVAGTRAKAAGSVMMTRQSGATRRVGDGDQGHAGDR